MRLVGSLLLATPFVTTLTLSVFQRTVPFAAAQSPTFTPTARVCAIHDFNPAVSDPATPVQISAIAAGDDGQYYTTSQSGGKSSTTANQGTIYRFSYSPGKTTGEVVFNFDNVAHGTTPMGGLIKSADGYFYGTTYGGGTYKTNDQGATAYGNGTLFRFKPGSAAPELIHTFRYGNLTGIKPANCPPKQPCYWSPQQRMNAAGGIPLSAPVQASDGNLYGVTSGAIGFGSLGVLYRVAPYNGESAITGLCIGGPMPAETSNPTDAQLRDQCMFNGKFGNMPFGLIADSNNHLFGTTLQVHLTSPISYGTVFRADLPSGQVTTLYNFTDATNGSTPYGVTLASDGYLYGVTKFGGPLYGPGNPGAGVIYRISPSGGNFQIVHAFNGNTEGAYPVAGLVEMKSSNGNDYLYGSTTAGGNNRGVLFRVLLNGIGPNPTGVSFPYEVVYAFPSAWSVAGSFPASTMTASSDPVYGPTLYGTTWTGGAFNYGALFRLSGVDLPSMQNLSVLPTYSLTSTSQHTGTSFTIPGQPQPTTIDVYTHSVAQQGSTPASTTYTDDGLMIKVGNCRSPHIVQFIYREKIGVDSQPLGGTFTLSNGQSYQYTTDENNPLWHSDTSGAPNAYYDQQSHVPVISNPLALTFFDQPNFGPPNYTLGAHETWKAVFKDYVVCNCHAVSEVKWTRQIRWIVDLPSAPNVTVDVNKGHQGPPEYVDVSVGPPDDPYFDWMNTQLRKDGVAPIP